MSLVLVQQLLHALVACDFRRRLLLLVLGGQIHPAATLQHYLHHAARSSFIGDFDSIVERCVVSEPSSNIAIRPVIDEHLHKGDPLGWRQFHCCMEGRDAALLPCSFSSQVRLNVLVVFHLKLDDSDECA